MVNITVKYGVDSHTQPFISQPTVGQVLADPTTKAVLGYGDNVKALLFGVEQDSGTVLGDGSVVTVETRANSKAGN